MSDELVAGFRRMFEYDGWANAATLDALRAGPAPPARRVRGWRTSSAPSGSGSRGSGRSRRRCRSGPISTSTPARAELVELAGEWARVPGGARRGRPRRRRRLPEQQGRVLDQHRRRHPDPREPPRAPTTAGRSRPPSARPAATPAYTDFIHAVAHGADRMTGRPRPGRRSWSLGVALVVVGLLVWSGRWLVRAPARRHPDRAGVGAGVHPARVDAAGVRGVEPDAVSGPALPLARRCTLHHGTARAAPDGGHHRDARPGKGSAAPPPGRLLDNSIPIPGPGSASASIRSSAWCPASATWPAARFSLYIIVEAGPPGRAAAAARAHGLERGGRHAGGRGPDPGRSVRHRLQGQHPQPGAARAASPAPRRGPPREPPLRGAPRLVAWCCSPPVAIALAVRPRPPPLPGLLQ